MPKAKVTYSQAKANLANPNRTLKKILERIDATEDEDDKALFAISYPKYATEILIYIAGI